MLTTLTEIKNVNHKAGEYYFSPDTMRFFKSRISETLYPVSNGAYFVTSEKGPDNVRRYSVRFAHDNGKIETVGKFQQYETSWQAHRAAYLASIK